MPGKILIILVFLFILFNLGLGLLHMMRDKGQTKKTVRALTWRIGLSVGLFFLIMLAYFTGYLQLHGIMP